MRYLNIGLIFSLVLLFVRCATNERPQTSTTNSNSPGGSPQLNTENADPSQVAKSALASLSSVLDEKATKELGLNSPDEWNSASLGEPVRLYLIRLDQLSQYKTATDPTQLLNDVHRTFYPVLVNGEGKLLIVLEQKDSAWKFVKYDSPVAAKNLVRIRHNKSAAAGGSSFLVVQVPSLQLTFLGQQATGQAPGAGKAMMLTPLTDLKENPLFRENQHFLMVNPTFTPEHEGSKNAKDVFKALVPVADKTLAEQKGEKKPT